MLVQNNYKYYVLFTNLYQYTKVVQCYKLTFIYYSDSSTNNFLQTNKFS